MRAHTLKRVPFAAPSTDICPAALPYPELTPAGGGQRSMRQSAFRQPNSQPSVLRVELSRTKSSLSSRPTARAIPAGAATLANSSLGPRRRLNSNTQASPTRKALLEPSTPAIATAVVAAAAETAAPEAPATAATLGSRKTMLPTNPFVFPQTPELPTVSCYPATNPLAAETVYK